MGRVGDDGGGSLTRLADRDKSSDRNFMLMLAMFLIMQSAIFNMPAEAVNLSAVRLMLRPQRTSRPHKGDLSNATRTSHAV